MWSSGAAGRSLGVMAAQPSRRRPASRCRREKYGVFVATSVDNSMSKARLTDHRTPCVPGSAGHPRLLTLRRPGRRGPHLYGHAPSGTNDSGWSSYHSATPMYGGSADFVKMSRLGRSSSDTLSNLSSFPEPPPTPGLEQDFMYTSGSRFSRRESNC